MAPELALGHVLNFADHLLLIQGAGTEHSCTNDTNHRQSRAKHEAQHAQVSVGKAGEGEAADSSKTAGAECLHPEDGALEGTVCDEVVQIGHSLHLTDVLKVGLVEPLEVLALKSERELLMLIYRSVLDLVHLVELSLEEHELLARVRLGVDHALLVLLEGVHHLEEVALGHEELIVLGVGSL